MDAFDKGSKVEIIPSERKIIGYCRNNHGGVPSNFHNYFIAVFDKDFISITVADSGPGIENIELAMQAGFSTASKKVREMGFGAGMGLPNIKKNTDELKIESKVGEGTTLFFKIYY